MQRIAIISFTVAILGCVGCRTAGKFAKNAIPYAANLLIDGIINDDDPSDPGGIRAENCRRERELKRHIDRIEPSY